MFGWTQRTAQAESKSERSREGFLATGSKEKPGGNLGLAVRI